MAHCPRALEGEATELGLCLAFGRRWLGDGRALVQPSSTRSRATSGCASRGRSRLTMSLLVELAVGTTVGIQNTPRSGGLLVSAVSEAGRTCGRFSTPAARSLHGNNPIGYRGTCVGPRARAICAPMARSGREWLASPAVIRCDGDHAMPRPVNHDAGPAATEILHTISSLPIGPMPL